MGNTICSGNFNMESIGGQKESRLRKFQHGKCYYLFDRSILSQQCSFNNNVMSIIFLMTQNANATRHLLIKEPHLTPTHLNLLRENPPLSLSPVISTDPSWHGGQVCRGTLKISVHICKNSYRLIWASIVSSFPFQRNFVEF